MANETVNIETITLVHEINAHTMDLSRLVEISIQRRVELPPETMQALYGLTINIKTARVRSDTEKDKRISEAEQFGRDNEEAILDIFTKPPQP